MVPAQRSRFRGCLMRGGCGWPCGGRGIGSRVTEVAPTLIWSTVHRASARVGFDVVAGDAIVICTARPKVQALPVFF